MSGYQRPRFGIGRGRMQLPRVDFQPVAAQVNAAFATIELADAQNVKNGQEAQFPSILLTDSNAVTWRLIVEPNGTLSLAQVPPR